MATVEELDAAVLKLKDTLIARSAAAANRAQADALLSKAAQDAGLANSQYDDAKAQVSGAKDVLVATVTALDAASQVTV